MYGRGFGSAGITTLAESLPHVADFFLRFDLDPKVRFLMLISLARAARTIAGRFSGRARPVGRRNRSVAFRTQFEPLEGRALLAGGGNLTYASYWVGVWHTTDGQLTVGETPGHHSRYPILFMALNTGAYNPPGSAPAPAYGFNLDPNIDPDSATLRGAVQTANAQGKSVNVGRFTLKANPNPNYPHELDSFTGTFNAPTGVVHFTGTYVPPGGPGSERPPDEYLAGWDLPRERPIETATGPPSGGSTPPTLIQEVKLKPTIQRMGLELRVVSPGAVEVTWVVTVKNTGPGNLPAGRAELVLSSSDGSVIIPLRLVSVVSSPDGQHGAISVHSPDFLKYNLPAISRGSTIRLVVNTWTTFSKRFHSERIGIDARIRDLAPSEQPGVEGVLNLNDVASVEFEERK
jgi:hypothetical protein